MFSVITSLSLFANFVPMRTKLHLSHLIWDNLQSSSIFVLLLVVDGPHYPHCKALVYGMTWLADYEMTLIFNLILEINFPFILLGSY